MGGTCRASMMNTILCRKLFYFAAPPVNSSLRWKLFVVRPFHPGNVFSTEAHPQDLFSHFASSKLKISEANINRLFRLAPHLQKLRTLHRVEGFLHLLKKHGCTEVQIANIIRVQPQLTGFTERVLEPKIKLLEDFGFVDRNLGKLLMSHPNILCHSLKNDLLPKMEFLKNVFQPQDILVKALLRQPRLLNYNLKKTLKPSLAFWKGWGFCAAELASFLQVDPIVLKETSLTPARVDLIHKIGAHKKGTKLFKYIVSAVTVSRMETLEANIENLKLCGLSTEETWQLLGAAPLVIFRSKEDVSEKMNLLLRKMELPVDYVVKHAGMLTLSLEKTMRPRCLVWHKIKSIDDLNLPLLRVLKMTEASFVSRIIKEHPESETLMKIYESAISNASNRRRRSTKA